MHLKNLTLLAFSMTIFLSCVQGLDDDDGLVKHRNKLGFSLRHQPGWKVSFEKGAYIQISNPSGNSRGIVFPFLAPKAMTADECLKRVPETFADVLPEGRLTTSKNVKPNPDEATAAYQYKHGEALGLCSVDGISGVLFLALTNDGVKSDTMKSIIDTFRTISFDEPGKLGSSAGLAMVDWTDPQERAFRIKTPKGWKTEGGLYRHSAVDIRLHIRITSPDKMVSIGFGDKDLPPFSSQAGATEGSVYNPGLGSSFIVKRFVSGGIFSRDYANQHADDLGCPEAQSQGKDLNELTAALQQQQDAQSQGLVRTIVSAGEATMSCKMEQEDRVGYIFSTVWLTTQSNDGTGTWQAFPSGYTAPRSRENEARQLVAEIYQSYKVEPAWFQAQQGTTAAVAQIVSQTSNQIASIFSKAAARTQATMDRIFRNWSNATLGQTDVVDAATGETWKIAAGKNYYWRRSGTNVVAGTNQYERPDIDFTPLLQY